MPNFYQDPVRSNRLGKIPSSAVSPHSGAKDTLILYTKIYTPDTRNTGGGGGAQQRTLEMRERA
jgi:hypothetical protein